MKPAIIMASLIALTIVGFALFAFGTIAVQNQHAVTERRSLSIASSAQREIKGNSAMIFASCQMRNHDLKLDNDKWHAMTVIEMSFKRPNNNSVDAAYHSARRKALLAARVADTANLKLNCFAIMRKAFSDSSGDLKPLVKDPKAVK